jgi:16S rRNA processing protein RimM
VPAEGGVLVGRLGKPNGLEGFLGLYVDRDDLIHFQPQSVVYVAQSPYTVRSVRQGKKGPQVAFEEITDREGAEAIRGSDVFVVEARELEEGEFWPSDLVGLAVRPGGGRVIGVEHGVSQDRLVIEREDHRFEVPFVDELVPVVDLEEGFVEIEELEGLSSPSERQ